MTTLPIGKSACLECIQRATPSILSYFHCDDCVLPKEYRDIYSTHHCRPTVITEPPKSFPPFALTTTAPPPSTCRPTSSTAGTLPSTSSARAITSKAGSWSLPISPNRACRGSWQAGSRFLFNSHRSHRYHGGISVHVHPWPRGTPCNSRSIPATAMPRMSGAGENMYK